MNLYLVVLGGKVPGGNVEVHDVRWVIGETIESTIPKLKSEWFGNASGLHIDSYKLINFVDGFQIKVIKTNQANKDNKNKLWFVNQGGYKAGEMLEQHHLKLVVATSAQIAKQKVRKKWHEKIHQLHNDNLAEIINFNDYKIVLEPDLLGRHDEMDPSWSGYWVIN